MHEVTGEGLGWWQGTPSAVLLVRALISSLVVMWAQN